MSHHFEFCVYFVSRVIFFFFVWSHLFCCVGLFSQRFGFVPYFLFSSFSFLFLYLCFPHCRETFSFGQNVIIHRWKSAYTQHKSNWYKLKSFMTPFGADVRNLINMNNFIIHIPYWHIAESIIILFTVQCSVFIFVSLSFSLSLFLSGPDLDSIFPLYITQLNVFTWKLRKFSKLCFLHSFEFPTRLVPVIPKIRNWQTISSSSENFNSDAFELLSQLYINTLYHLIGLPIGWKLMINKSF